VSKLVVIDDTLFVFVGSADDIAASSDDEDDDEDYDPDNDEYWKKVGLHLLKYYSYS